MLAVWLDPKSIWWSPLYNLQTRKSGQCRKRVKLAGLTSVDRRQREWLPSTELIAHAHQWRAHSIQNGGPQQLQPQLSMGSHLDVLYTSFTVLWSLNLSYCVGEARLRDRSIVDRLAEPDRIGLYGGSIWPSGPTVALPSPLASSLLDVWLGSYPSVIAAAFARALSATFNSLATCSRYTVILELQRWLDWGGSGWMSRRGAHAWRCLCRPMRSRSSRDAPNRVIVMCRYSLGGKFVSLGKVPGSESSF